ncbi:hypothetical protein GCM10007416_09730 [Kroppenstedtia guangzhouensis]|uniref:Uncharacterized protein n=1 Tax=Kroppenstedtia guangzhouensis TaxID=1274356 RepID=A0ABQ1G8L1_9BACL|nr:hypothetical protein [Kroppenstedtia guangzhouensis]GGA38821.1 hypothetical protein GCM10007416_09730 [Kroppenstedtia guangzhouensis]
MGVMENLLLHLIAIPAIFLLGRLSAVKVTGFRVRMVGRENSSDEQARSPRRTV